MQTQQFVIPFHDTDLNLLSPFRTGEVILTMLSPFVTTYIQ